MTADTEPVGRTAEQAIYNIASRADIVVLREPGQSLSAFAEYVKEEIASKIIALDQHIDEIEALDLDEEHTDDARAGSPDIGDVQ